MINYDEVARDLYALGSWTVIGILIATLAYLRNTALIIEVLIALGIAFILNGLFNADERVIRLIIVLTAIGLLAGSVRSWIIIGIIGIATLVMASRYLDRQDVGRSALVGVLVQGLALLAASFI